MVYQFVQCTQKDLLGTVVYIDCYMNIDLCSGFYAEGVIPTVLYVV